MICKITNAELITSPRPNAGLFVRWKKKVQIVIGFTSKRHFKLIISFHKLFMSHFVGRKKERESVFSHPFPRLMVKFELLKHGETPLKGFGLINCKALFSSLSSLDAFLRDIFTHVAQTKYESLCETLS